jgi:hypothetical protein
VPSTDKKRGVISMNAKFHIGCACLFLLLIPYYASCQQRDMANARIVFQTNSMNDVIVKRGVVYSTAGKVSLSMDLYYPPSTDRSARYPLVVFVFGFPDTVMYKMIGRGIKDMGQYVSWSQLIASSGLAALTYETLDPAADIKNVIQYVRTNASTLQIDPDRIAIWSCSGNVPTALSVMTKESHDYLRCAVLYYGITLELPGSTKVSGLVTGRGAAYPTILSTPDSLRWDVPMFLVRAGLDNVPYLNEALARFVNLAISKNAPLHFHNLPNAQHGFEVWDNNDTSRYTIERTVEFLKDHLLPQKGGN